MLHHEKSFLEFEFFDIFFQLDRCPALRIIKNYFDYIYSMFWIQKRYNFVLNRVDIIFLLREVLESNNFQIESQIFFRSMNFCHN